MFLVKPVSHVSWTRVGELDLDEVFFTKNLRSARRAAASRPSGMTFGHLRPILDSTRDTHLLHERSGRQKFCLPSGRTD